MRNGLAVLLVALGACGNPAPSAAPVEPVSNTGGAGPAPSLAVVLVIDRSGSMQGAKLEAIRDGAGRVARVLPADAELALIAFDTEPHVLLPLTLVSDQDAIAKGIAFLEVGGGTQFLPSLIAARELLAGSQATRKHVVFLSDGQAAYDGVEDAARALHDGGVTITTVAIPEADRELLRLISAAGGGRTLYVPDVASVAATLETEVRLFASVIPVP